MKTIAKEKLKKKNFLTSREQLVKYRKCACVISTNYQDTVQRAKSKICLEILMSKTCITKCTSYFFFQIHAHIVRILIQVSRNKRGLSPILNRISSDTTPSARSPLSTFLILIGILLMRNRLLWGSFVIKRQTKRCLFLLTYFVIFL